LANQRARPRTLAAPRPVRVSWYLLLSPFQVSATLLPVVHARLDDVVEPIRIQKNFEDVAPGVGDRARQRQVQMLEECHVEVGGLHALRVSAVFPAISMLLLQVVEKLSGGCVGGIGGVQNDGTLSIQVVDVGLHVRTAYIFVMVPPVHCVLEQSREERFGGTHRDAGVHGGHHSAVVLVNTERKLARARELAVTASRAHSAFA